MVTTLCSLYTPKRGDPFLWGKRPSNSSLSRKEVGGGGGKEKQKEQGEGAGGPGEGSTPHTPLLSDVDGLGLGSHGA